MRTRIAMPGWGLVAGLLYAAPLLGLWYAADLHAAEIERGSAMLPIDYTAYTLAPGEVGIGPGFNMGVGPRMQLGTTVWLQAVSVPNVSFKFTPLRLGPTAFSSTSRYAFVQKPDLGGEWFEEQLTGTLEVARPLALHASVSWDWASIDGVPDLTELSPALAGKYDDMLDVASVLAGLSDTSPELSALMVRGQAVVEVRVNSNHSFLLQGSAFTFGEVGLPDGTVNASDYVPVIDDEGSLEPGSIRSASISWQAASRHMAVRLGIGTSSIPGMWLTQTTRLTFRFGSDDDARALAARPIFRSHEDKEARLALNTATK